MIRVVKRCVFCFFGVLMTHVYGVSNKMQVISSISEIRKTLETADQNTLVVFDVDQVIVMFDDPILRLKGYQLLKKIWKDYTFLEKVKSVYTIFQNTKHILIEEETKKIIHELKEKNIPTLALTGLWVHRVGAFDDPLGYRIKELQKLGIEMNPPEKPKRYYFNKDSGYDKGVILSGATSKGEALFHILKNVMAWMPKRIIFVDDDSHYIESVQKEAKAHNIDVTCFKYQATCFKNDPDPDENVLRYQVESIVKKDTFISYKDAQIALSSKSRLNVS